MTADQIKRIFPECRDPGTWGRILPVAMKEFGIDSAAEQAAFLAQVGHESGQLNHLVENLNYSARGLMKTWPKRFPTIESAAPFHRRPDMIANVVYANRLGNGPPETGDGYRYRGRGLIQITGKDNYAECGKALGMALISTPQRLEDRVCAARSAAWYWRKVQAENFLGLDDKDEVFRITLRVNGGTSGLAERMAFYQRAKIVLGVSGD